MDAALEVVLPDGARVPLTGTLSIGRAADNAIQLDDRSVSRHHARVDVGRDGAWVEDAGSTHGTFLDGKPIGVRARLRDGARVHVGNVEFRVERRRTESEAGRTIVVRPGASLLISAVGASEVDATATSYGFRPTRALGLGAQAARGGGGDAPLGAQGPARGRRASCAWATTRPRVFRQLDGSTRSRS